jgi:hypothetical protein
MRKQVKVEIEKTFGPKPQFREFYRQEVEEYTMLA